MTTIDSPADIHCPTKPPETVDLVGFILQSQNDAVVLAADVTKR